MKKTLSTSEVVNELLSDEYAGWSYNGAKALAEYLEQYEEDCGIEIEIDVVALRCEYSEYESAIDCVDTCGYSDIDYEDDYECEEDKEADALAFLQENTNVVEFDNGIIIQGF